jgi:hypothetical protein
VARFSTDGTHLPGVHVAGSAGGHHLPVLHLGADTLPPMREFFVSITRERMLEIAAALALGTAFATLVAKLAEIRSPRSGSTSAGIRGAR